eukprot:3922035-Rhodomonas_salina.1
MCIRDSPLFPARTLPPRATGDTWKRWCRCRWAEALGVLRSRAETTVGGWGLGQLRRAQVCDPVGTGPCGQVPSGCGVQRGLGIDEGVLEGRVNGGLREERLKGELSIYGLGGGAKEGMGAGREVRAGRRNAR